MQKLKVAVLYGGRSSEREVSLSSGRTVMERLDNTKYEIKGFDVPDELEKMLEWGPDVSMIVMHGAGGEDGTIQGYLETKGIAYTGCGVAASAVGMSKKLFRKIMEADGIRMPAINSKTPCVIKPSNGGSSIGVSIVKDDSELKKAVDEAKKYDSEVVCEEYIEGIEVSCGVLGNDNLSALPVIEIIPKKDFFDYEAKYQEGMSEEICPARLTDELTAEVQKLAVKVFEAIGGRGYARVDMIIRGSDIYVLEINTIPGMTPNSLLPKEAAAMGMSYEELLDKLIELSLR